MKSNLLKSIRLTLVLILFFSGFYTLIILGIAQLAPNRGQGETVTFRNKTYYTNIGQSFTEDRYFWSRPSETDYNAANSGASNKGPSNPQYLKLVQARIDTFMVHNPVISRNEIPALLVTASGSGLDPDISPQAALIQVKRIAKIRNISEGALRKLVEKYTNRPLLGLFGPTTVNVLKLNIALDSLKTPGN
ncbi:MAG: K(+)-transporting ATPase subunit C [Bacteroidales bacterium]|nr:K(+)-transporting ATPase subunit C [Bacteroidales bacterium]